MAEQHPFGDIAFAANPEPRCACILLLDTSGSMAEVVQSVGESLGYTVQQDGQTYQAVSGGITRIDLLNEGLRVYHSDIMGDSLAAQRVEISIISFGGSVQTVTPFVTADQFSPPTLVASGDTPMGAAIVQAIDAIEERKKVYKQNGVQYYRPWIFFITDGGPTDAWKTAASRVRDGEARKSFAFFAVGVEGANFEILRQITAPERPPAALKGYSFREMFRWLSSSQRSVSHSKPGEESQVPLQSPSGWASL
jgi:uncharacterized protein YegL